MKRKEEQNRSEVERKEKKRKIEKEKEYIEKPERKAVGIEAYINKLPFSLRLDRPTL